MLGSQRRGSLELSEWLLAPSMSLFRFCTVCLGDLDYVSNSPTEESAQENAFRAGELKHTHNTWKQSKDRQPELPCCFLQLRVPRKATLQPCVCTRAQLGQHCSAAARTPTVCQIYSGIKLIAQESYNHQGWKRPPRSSSSKALRRW